MRSTKFLATLLVAAMFASCAKEEFTQENVIQDGEFVGAELLGSNISIDFGKDSDTKLTAAGWETTDTLGLAWLLSGSTTVGDPQTTADPTTANLYSNHMYEKGSTGQFSTKGNVYKGWHFAYYPFEYQERIGQEMKGIVVNPTQTLDGQSLAMNDMFHVSARAFLTKEDLDENMQLTGVKLDMVSVFRPIGVTVKPTEFLSDSDAMKNLTITSLTITADEDFSNAGSATYSTLFTSKVDLNAYELPEIQFDEDDVYDEDATKEEIREALDNVFTPSTDCQSNSITTNVENESIDLSKDQFLRVFVRPTDKDITKSHVKFVVKVVGGTFTITYKDAEALAALSGDAKEAAKTNNEAIEDFVKAYDADAKGALSSYTAEAKSLLMDLVLDKSNFTADFSDIKDIDKWNKAVAVANRMAYSSKPTFTVTGDIHITADKALQMPTMGLNVVTQDNAKISIETDLVLSTAMATAFSANDHNNVIVVNKGATLEVPKNVSLDAKVTNRGTINVGEVATVKTVDNSDGRINVVYGSFVEAEEGKEGIVAYKALGNNEDKAKDINTLMTAGSITINTIVVEEGKTFDLAMKQVDPYASGGYTYLQSPIESMNFELYGGTLKSSTNAKEVANVEIKSGDNTLSNVLMNNLDIIAGKVTVESAYYSNTYQEIRINQITNNATLLANTDIYANVISTQKDASTLVSAGSTIWYFTSHNQFAGSSVVGPVTKTDIELVGGEIPVIANVRERTAFIAAMTSNKYIVLSGDITLKKGDLDITDDRGYTLDGKVIDGKGHTIITSNTVAEGKDGVAVLKLKSTTLKNITFAAPTTNYDVRVSSGDVTIENCNFLTATDESMGKGKRAVFVENGYTGTLSVKNCKFDDKVYAFNSNAEASAKINFEMCELNGWLSGYGIHTFKNCTFGKSGDYQNYIPYTAANFINCTLGEDFAISLRHLPAGGNIKFDADSRVGAVRIANPTQVKWDLSGQTLTDTPENQTLLTTVMNGQKNIYVKCDKDGSDNLTNGHQTVVNVSNTLKVDEGTIATVAGATWYSYPL